ncbi:MAG: acyltransferase, partial [Variovorax sp.]|nr:acyltransferase [Variovorax sp.]
LLLSLVGAATLALAWRSRIAIALVTALSLALLQRLGWLERVPAIGGATLARLGRISYSLFLIHFPVLLLVNAAVSQLMPAGPWIDAAGLAVALALSLGAAGLLHRWVEMQSQSWRAVLVLFGGLLVCGAVGNVL